MFFQLDLSILHQGFGDIHLLGIFGLLMVDCLFGCPIYNFLGIACPGCGLTRAWLCFLRGEWRAAVRYHLLFFPTPVFIFLFAHRERLPRSRLLDFSLLVFALSMAAYHLWRIFISFSPFVLICTRGRPGPCLGGGRQKPDKADFYSRAAGAVRRKTVRHWGILSFFKQALNPP